MGLLREKSSVEADAPRWWPELGWLDWLSLALISVLLLALCVVRSRSRLFWSDETFGFTVLRDPVLAHTLHGWWEGSDSGGLLYYLIGHVWFRVFGASPLVLRLFSTTCFLVAMTTIWAMARRVYVVPVVAIATALTFFVPAYLMWQGVNGRFYGLFLASAAFAAACTMAAVERRGRSRLLVLLTGCAHAWLIGSHILGLVYSAGLLAALVISDLHEGRRRLSLYGGVVLAWMVMVPLSYHSIRATATIAQGVFWPVRPHFRDLIFGFFAYNHKLVLLAALLLLAAVIRRLAGSVDDQASQPSSHARHALLVVGGGLVLAQLAIFAKSRIGLSVYTDRYLLPLTIAMVLVFCEGLTRAMGASLVRRSTRPLPAVLVTLAATGVLFAMGVRSDSYAQLYAGLDYPSRVEKILPPGRDVVVTYVPTFMLLRLFDPTHHYIFATDWSYDGAKAGADLSGQRMMENVERGGFAPHEVLDLPVIVQELPEFSLLAEPDRLPWLQDRFLRSGDFEVTRVGGLADWYPMTVWRIRCLHPETGCRAGASAGK